MSGPAAGRIRGFDWLRGLAVPFMLQCHAMVLLRPPLRSSTAGHVLLWLDGLVAPSFMLAAGFALALVQIRGAAQGRATFRRLKTLRRIGEVLLVATLVNWMWFPIFREPKWILRVDILQCIGLSLLLAFPVITYLAKRPRVLMGVSLLIALAIFFAAPFGASVTGPWAMLANKTTGAVFPLLPWTAYVFLGAVFGAIAATRDPITLAKSLGVMGVITGALWWATPFFARLYPAHEFATANPAEHAKRLTVIVFVLLTFLHIENKMPALGRLPPFRVLDVFGTSSMSAYFFHEALLYFHVFGLCFNVLWGSRQGWVGYALLTVLLIALTFALSWLTDRLYRVVSPKLDALLEPRPVLQAHTEP